MFSFPSFHKFAQKETFNILFFVASLLICTISSAQSIVNFSRIPTKLQLYARNIHNQSTVPVAGQVVISGYDNVSIIITRNNIRWQYLSTQLIYQNGKASFFLFPTIQSGLFEYRFRIFIKHGSDSSLLADRDSIVCGDAFIVSGQSNARLADDRENYQNQYCRTFGKTTVNGNAGPSLLGDTLWTLSKANGFVNVGVWALNLQRLLVQKHKVPVCIINGGVSQTKVTEHLKNASDPDFYTKTYYGRLKYRVMKSGLSNSLKALFWYQGESDSEQDFAYYKNSFSQLYYDWHDDYPSLQKIYMFQINIGCTSNDLSGQFREGQRKTKDLFPDIKTLATVGTPYFDGCHYDTAGYHFLAKQIYNCVATDFYGVSVQKDGFSPEISKAYFTSGTFKEIILEFSNAANMKWQEDTLGKYLKNLIYLDGDTGLISSGYASGNKIRLVLKATSRRTFISYLPSFQEIPPFIGPCIRNSQYFGAFSFYNFRIELPPVIGIETGCPGAFGPVKHVYGTNRKNTLGRSITRNVTWHKDTIYILHDFVRVSGNATLTIEPGTIIMGSLTPLDSSVLIIEKGSKLYAKGTPSSPIVFTSCRLQGTRNRGDWGGLVICGGAPNNVGINIELEGGYKAFHGGTTPNDNSGALQYVRIEYAGIKFAENEETNGLTLASVGKTTSLNYIQVSFSNDDSFEWFGGNVDGKYLISWKALDDDFDTDLGYTGNNQFGLGYRDYAIADVSGSNGFESDNNSVNYNAFPTTAPLFSNFEVWGPRLTNLTPFNNYFKSGAHLRTKTEIKFYNSLFLGWPGDSATKKAALFIEGTETVANVKKDSIRFRNCFTGSYLPNILLLSDIPNIQWSPFASMGNWYYRIANKDSTSNNIQLTAKKAPFKEIPIFTISSSSSRFNRGSSFRTGTLPKLPIAPAGFFLDVSYRGAFGGRNWATGWTEFNPNIVIYAANGYSLRKAEMDSLRHLTAHWIDDNHMSIFPNPVIANASISFFSGRRGPALISIFDINSNLVSSKYITTIEGLNTIQEDFSTLNSGLYFIKLKNGLSLLTSRLMKL